MEIKKKVEIIHSVKISNAIKILGARELHIYNENKSPALEVGLFLCNFKLVSNGTKSMLFFMCVLRFISKFAAQQICENKD